MEFNTRSANGSYYQLSQTAKVYVGRGSLDDYGCACTLSHVRIYVDYFPSSADEMINLAIMDQGKTSIIFQKAVNFILLEGNLYLFHFWSDPLINGNSTIPVLSIGSSSNTSLTASKGI